MYSSVVSFNPNTAESMIYYAWDALNAACALAASSLDSACAVVPSSLLDNRDAGGGSSAGGGGGRRLCSTGISAIEHGVQTQAVLSGPSRGAIRVVAGGAAGGRRSGVVAGEGRSSSLADSGEHGVISSHSDGQEPAGGAAEKLSAKKTVSVVAGVIPQDFYQFLLTAFKRS